MSGSLHPVMGILLRKPQNHEHLPTAKARFLPFWRTFGRLCDLAFRGRVWRHFVTSISRREIEFIRAPENFAQIPVSGLSEVSY